MYVLCRPERLEREKYDFSCIFWINYAVRTGFFQLNCKHMSIVEWISMPWHWAVGGLAIALLSVAMTLMGRKFGVSSGFKVLCAYADRISEIWRYTPGA